MTFLTESLAELWLDDLNLMGETTDSDGNTFTIEALAEDATWDNPVPVDVSVQRWMTDGAVASTQGHENRTPYFKVKVEAGTSAELAAGEAALAKRSGKPCNLAWTPPEGRSVAPTTVFEVWTWHLESTLDGIDERNLRRMYGVRMTAKPWVRSEEITEVSVLNSVSTVASVAIDTCSSTTGWTGAPNTATASGGQLHESYAVTSGDVSTGTGIFGVTLTRAGSVTGLGSTPYLVIDATVTGGKPSLYVLVDGVLLDKVAALGTSTWWDLNGVTSFSELQVSALVQRNTAGTVTLNLNDVSAADTPGGIGTHRQLFRSLEPGGSVPTSGSLCVASPDSTPLKTVLLYTAPESNGFVPAMRRYRTSGNDESLATDSTTMSGAKERIDSAGIASGATFTSTIPGDQLREATYAIVARMQATASGLYQQITVTGSMAGRTNYKQLQTNVNFAASSTWQWVVLGVMALPPSPTPAESTLPFTVNISGNIFLSGTPQVWIDELYLFDVTHGDLTMVQTSDPSAVPASTKTRMWVDAPDADPIRNRPAIYLGTTDDRSDALSAAYWQILALGDHDLDPDSTLVFTVTEGVNDANVSARYFKRWHTNAGE